MPLFLADTSIWSWAEKLARPDIAEKLAQRLERREVATCVPIALEVMHRAETGEEFESRFVHLLEPLDWIPLDDAGGRRALEVQRELAPRSHGNHRRPAVDFLIAAAAEGAGDDVTLWFFDRDLRVICEHTGQPYEAEEAA